MIAQSGINAHRRSQLLQMRFHVFFQVCIDGIVHQIARQQHHVDLFLLHDVRQLVQLTRAKQNSQVQITGHADTQRLIHFLIDEYGLIADNGRIGVIHPKTEQTGHKQRRKQPQASRKRLACHKTAQQKIQDKCRQRGIHHKQQDHHPKRHHAEHHMPQFQQQADQQAVCNEIGNTHQPTSANFANPRRKQPLQRTPKPKCKHLQQNDAHKKHLAKHAFPP